MHWALLFRKNIKRTEKEEQKVGIWRDQNTIYSRDQQNVYSSKAIKNTVLAHL